MGKIRKINKNCYKKMISREDLYKAPFKQGLYFLFDSNKNLIYVGKSKNIYNRLFLRAGPYFYNRDTIKKFEYFRYTLIKDTKILDKTEIKLIKKLKPKLNKKHNKKHFYSLQEKKKTVDDAFK